MPSKRVIVLDNIAQNTWRVVFWADVPAARQAKYANASATSAWPGASASDITALQNGSVVERVDAYKVNGALAAAEADLQTQWTRFQADINAANPWNFYGTFWDGAAWTVAGLA